MDILILLRLSAMTVFKMATLICKVHVISLNFRGENEEVLANKRFLSM